jgi:hypothetical protein
LQVAVLVLARKTRQAVPEFSLQDCQPGRVVVDEPIRMVTDEGLPTLVVEWVDLNDVNRSHVALAHCLTQPSYRTHARPMGVGPPTARLSLSRDTNTQLQLTPIVGGAFGLLTSDLT